MSYICFMGKRLNYPSLIEESREDLEALLKQQTDAVQRDRLRFLLYLKTGESLTQSDAAKRINLSTRQGQRDWAKYCKAGIKGLLEIPKGGAPCKLDDTQLDALKKRLKQDDIQFLHQAVEHVKKTYKKSYGTSGMHYVFKRLKVKKRQDDLAISDRTNKA